MVTYRDAMNLEAFQSQWFQILQKHVTLQVKLSFVFLPYGYAESLKTLDDFSWTGPFSYLIINIIFMLRIHEFIYVNRT